MATVNFIPLPPSLQKTLEDDLAKGTWSVVTREFFAQIERKLKELERRLEALEP